MPLTCFITQFYVFRANQRQSSLPLKPSDYTAFIQESRAFQDQLDMGKLTLVVYIVCFLLQGPYLFLNLGLQIRNSKELVNSYDGVQYLAGEEETLITLLKYDIFGFFLNGFKPIVFSPNVLYHESEDNLRVVEWKRHWFETCAFLRFQKRF